MNLFRKITMDWQNLVRSFFLPNNSTEFSFEHAPSPHQHAKRLKDLGYFNPELKIKKKIIRPLKVAEKSVSAVQERAIAPLEPMLIPYALAWTKLEMAIKKISPATGIHRLALVSYNRQKRSYRVKSGIWGAQGTRMFFAYNKQDEIIRVYIQINKKGYPIISDPEDPDPFEVRLVSTQREVTKKESEKTTIQRQAANGLAHTWIEELPLIIKEYKRDCEKFKKLSEMGTLEFAEKSHVTACRLLGLDSDKKPILKKEVNNAYKDRMKIVHPDKNRNSKKDAEGVAKALTWARNFLCPL